MGNVYFLDKHECVMLPVLPQIKISYVIWTCKHLRLVIFLPTIASVYCKMLWNIWWKYLTMKLQMQTQSSRCLHYTARAEKYNWFLSYDVSRIIRVNSITILLGAPKRQLCEVDNTRASKFLPPRFNFLSFPYYPISFSASTSPLSSLEFQTYS